MLAMTPVTCARTASNSTRGSPATTPKRGLFRIACAAFAAASKAFEGTHPVFRHSPPIYARSIRTTRLPSCAAIEAAVRPADPAPMMQGSAVSSIIASALAAARSFPAAVRANAVLLQFRFRLEGHEYGHNECRDQSRREKPHSSGVLFPLPDCPA